MYKDEQQFSISFDHSTKVRLGKVLRFLGCESKHTREGAVYRLVQVAA